MKFDTIYYLNISGIIPLYNIIGYIETIVSFVWLANSKLKINKNTYIHIRVIITI